MTKLAFIFYAVFIWINIQAPALAKSGALSYCKNQPIKDEASSSTPNICKNILEIAEQLKEIKAAFDPLKDVIKRCSEENEGRDQRMVNVNNLKRILAELNATLSKNPFEQLPDTLNEKRFKEDLQGEIEELTLTKRRLKASNKRMERSIRSKSNLFQSGQGLESKKWNKFTFCRSNIEPRFTRAILLISNIRKASSETEKQLATYR